MDGTKNSNIIDPVINPARMLSTISRRLLSHPSKMDKTSIYSCVNSSSVVLAFSQSQVLSYLKIVAAVICEDQLGFSPNKIVTLSIRTIIFMCLFMACKPILHIKLMESRSHCDWIGYVHKKVLSLSREFQSLF